MKRAKLLSLFLAGALLFQTAGIDALATEPAVPAPISETVEGADSDLSEQPADEEGNPDQPAEGDETKNPAGEEGNPDQPAEGDESKNPAGEEVNPDQPAEGDETKDPAEEAVDPEKPSDGDEGNDPAEEETPDQPSEEETEGQDPAVEEGEDDASLSENSVSENTVSENTISENTLPEESEASIFSIFPGLGDNYQFSAEELKDKQVLASHLRDVVQISSIENATLADFADTSDQYEHGEVVYLAETREKAEQVAAAFGGTLQSYSYEVAVIDLPEQATVALAVAAAAESEIKLPAVWPNYYSYLHTETNATVNPLVPTDPDYNEQWFHDYIGTRYAWAAGYKGQGVKVAVIDTGLSRNHEDLAANAVDGKTFVNGANGTTQNTDNQTHGTHVAGIIAADDNNKGGVGVAPDATIRGYSVFAADGTCKTSWIKSAINAAVIDGNDIINMSLGSPNYDAQYEEVINNAYDNGVTIFASSGNDDTGANNYPAAYANTISIGAIDENGTRASFSSYGSTVTLSFPGVDIYSTTNKGYQEGDYTYPAYASMDGTSMASPAAAGTAAVILSAREDIRNKTGKDKVKALLAAMKSSTTKCANSGMGAGTTYLPGVLKLATDASAPETPVIEVVDENKLKRGTNNKDYIAESLQVTISTKTAVGVDIYYSTNGKTPTYKNGAITNADSTAPYKLGTPITLTGAKSKTIKAIAVNPFSGKVSKVATKTVTLTPIPNGVTVEPVGNVKRVVAGKNLKFTATVTPSYAISNKVGWSVDDKAKSAGITVTNGTVKTKSTTAAGTYTVTATAVGSTDKTKYDGKSKDYTFTVIAKSDIKKVAFIDSATKSAPKSKSIKTTDSKTTDAENAAVIDLSNYLVVTKIDNSTLDSQAALAEVVWSSSNAKVATVSDEGIISAVAPGKAVIKATSNDGANKSASYTVTVVQPVTGIAISGPQKVAAGRGIALTANITPANASNKKVVWSVGGDGNMRINANNGKITTTASASGSYTVTAKAADGLIASVSDTYTVTIVSGEITQITLDQTKLTLFPPKTTPTADKTTATLTPDIKSKGTADTSLIFWSSSAPSIASVDQSGKITAKAPGKATITCAAIDGSNKKATCAVTVSVPMSKLVIGPTDGNDGIVAIGKKVKMVAKYYSNYGTPTNKQISWDIVGYSNPTLAEKVKIDKNGTISVNNTLTLPSTGAAVAVRATAKDGSGVQSNVCYLEIRKTYLKARVVYSPNGGYIIQASTVKNPKPNDWEWVPDYCTATLSGSKQSGLHKSRDRLEGDPDNIYAVYAPIPGKKTTNPAFENERILWSTIKKECEKMTLTIKLKDGSNLSAKITFYGAIYVDAKGNERVVLFET